MKAHLFACLAALGIALSAQAQDTKPNPIANALDKISGHDAKAEVGDFLKALTVDMPVTTPPATFLLGLGDTTVPRVSTFRAFGAQAAQAVGDDGKLHGTMAVEINPLLASGPVSWKDYDQYASTRVLTRTTVSVATVASDSASSARSAYGVQSVVYSSQVKQLADAAASKSCQKVAPEFAKADPTTETMPGSVKPGFKFPLPETAQTDAKDCQALIEGLLTKWNPTSLIVGLGQSQYSSDGGVRHLKAAASGIWISATWGYDWDAPPDKDAAAGEASKAKKAQDRLGLGATLHVRRMWHERATDPADESVLVDENSTLFGLNLRGGNARFGGLLEASLRKGRAPALHDENRKRVFAGLEVRLMEGLYVSAGIGSDTGRRDGKNQRVSLVNLKWGFSGDSVFKP